MIESSDFRNGINVYAYNLTLQEVEEFLNRCQKEAIRYYCSNNYIIQLTHSLPRKDEMFICLIGTLLRNNKYEYKLNIEGEWIEIKWNVKPRE